MIEFLTKKGFSVHLTACGVLLTRKDAPDLTWDYATLKAAYNAQGGPQRHLQYTGGR